ncbi:MAG: Bro-N domain-containing protein [Alistipes sp.]
MGNLSIINHPDFGQVRNVVIKGEPWFVAKDICDVLGLVKYRDAIASLDNDEKQGCPLLLDTLGGKQTMTVVSESGMYALIFQSRKPTAKVFKKWVTSEVLPAIRKYGCYIMPGDQASRKERNAIERAFYKELGKHITDEDVFKIAKKSRKGVQYVGLVLCGEKRDNEIMRQLQARAVVNKDNWNDAYAPTKLDEVLSILK